MDRNDVKGIAQQHEMPLFVPLSGVKIAIEDADEQGGNNVPEDDDDGRNFKTFFIFTKILNKYFIIFVLLLKLIFLFNKKGHFLYGIYLKTIIPHNFTLTIFKDLREIYLRNVFFTILILKKKFFY